MFSRIRYSFIPVSAFLALALVPATSVLAQEKQYSENKTDQALKSDARVDPSTLGMSLEIPLGGAPGRGASIASTIRYSSKHWRLKYAGGFQGNILFHTRTKPAFSENSMAGWTSSLDGPWIEYSGREQPFDENGHPLSDDPQAEYNTVCYVLRIHLHLPDGSSSEFRKSDTPECDLVGVPTPVFTGTFYSTDGSRMRFDADNGVLYLPDGGRYFFAAEQTVQRYNSQYLTARWATQFIDRNGNTISYSFSGVTDTLGRSYANPLASNPSAGNQTYYVPGFGGQNLTYTLVWDNLANVLISGSPPIAYTAAVKCVSPNVYESVEPSPFLFNSTVMTKVCADEDMFNPVVLKRVDLPNGRSYSFEYNIHGEIVKITYPTGGYERFLYGEIAPLSYTKVPYKQTNRGVVERWVSPSGNGSEEASQHWTYSAGGTPYKTSILAPNGTRADRFLHGSGGGVGQSFGFDTPLGGMAYEEATVINSSGQMLRRSLTEWQVSGPQSGGDSTASRDPRVIKSINLILDTGGNALAAATTTQYDADLNPFTSSAYDYFSVDATTAQTAAIGSTALSLSGRTPLRTEETTYVVSDTLIAAAVRQQYRDRQLLGLTSSSRVKNSADSIVAQSEVKYDETAYAPLTYGAVTGWNDPGTTVRGMPTTSRSWLNPSGIWLETHAQYDQCGSPRKSWDALGKVSEVAYSSTYHYAYPTSTTSADPDGAGPLTSLTSATVYDLSSGKVTSTVDANSQTTSFEYSSTTPMGQPNQLQRLTRVNRPDGSWTKYNYGYASGAYFTNTNVSIDATRNTDSYEFADGLGRPRRSFMNEGATWIVSDTQYDTMGRVWRVSNPYRSTQADEGAVNPSGAWTTSVYDALGRVATVTTPDNAVVSTSYSGNIVTVTDQAGRKRKSVTDGLGRLKEVYEDPTSLNYLTSYSYDVLDNLTTVSQGGQTRTFVYDSLKRLTSATNPESGTISYVYDANGNLTQKTDARSVATTYVYDALNRNTTVDYSNTTSINPDLTRSYDTAANGKGRLSESYAGGSEGVGVTVEHTKIQSYDAMGRSLDLRQRFKSNSVWGDSTRTYKTERTYGLFGHVKTQTYPSGRLVAYNYDAAGRLGDKDAQNLAFSGGLGDGVTRTYSSEILYSPLGGMTKEKFGTDTALYNKQFYNSRGQLAEIRVGTYHTTDPTFWNRGAIINHYSDSCWGSCGGSSSTTPMTDNNGNLKKQDVYIPNSEQAQQVTDFTNWWQQYNYDSLNRLDWVREISNGSEIWKQSFTYDRYGNRTIHQTSTWGPVSGPAINKKEFTVNTANNRLGVPGVQSGELNYDAAGNLTRDTYSGSGYTRAYDAENRMTSETQSNGYVAGSYVYNADGQRVRRKVGSTETWQVYGMDGELLAEYAVNASSASPQKEYGYRNGQLLITAEAVAATRTNMALAANGATATAQNYTADVGGSHYRPADAIDGTRYAPTAPPPGDVHDFWRDEHGLPSWLQIDFNGQKTIDEIDVFTLRQDFLTQADPSPTDTFNNYGVTAFDVQSWTGSAWQTVPGGSITNNNLVWKKLTFTAVTTSKIRVVVNAAVDGIARICEVEAWGPAPPVNVALAANGATATGQNYTADVGGSHYRPADAIDGTRYAPTAPPPGDVHDFWRDEHGLPSWLQIDFNGQKAIDEIDVFTLRQDFLTQADPSPTDTFNNYGVTAFDVQYWTGSAWQTVPGGSITNNNLVWKKLIFTAVTTSKIRVMVNAAVDGIARICEVEAWGTAASGGSSTANINWLVTDQLGTPRMVFDKAGSLAGTKRHDYLPFGEELVATQGARTTGLGYAADSVRQKFTSKERDNETGLDYFLARYYSSAQGRFTSADSWAGRGVNPQSFNRYAYVVNNPLKYVDLWGHEDELPKKKGKKGDDDVEPGEGDYPLTPDGAGIIKIQAPARRYIPDSRQIFHDWFDVLRGRYSYGSYMRNAGEFLNQSMRNGEAEGKQISNTVEDILDEPEVMLFGGVLPGGFALQVEKGAFVTVGRWMSKLELDNMLATGLVQQSHSGTTHVASPATISAYINEATAGRLYVQFEVPASSVKITSAQRGWAKILGPSTTEGRLAAMKGMLVPQMPRARNIQVIAGRTKVQ